MKCKVCSRDSQKGGFCTVHHKAYENLVEKFQVWQKATDVSWSQYLGEIQKNSLTGVWAKEVAKYLIEEEEQ
ncbi:MAG: hypothetical protein ACM3UY_09240 [Methanocella sp.]